MSTTRHSRSHPARLVVAVVLLAASLTACSGDTDSPTDSPTDSGGPPAPSATSARDVARSIGRTLANRADAVRRADDAAFGRQVGGTRAFRASQQVWLHNLTQLPIGLLSYRVEPSTLVRDGDAYRVTVRQVLQLDGYDVVPVVSEGRYRFAPAPGQPERLRLVAMSQRDRDTEHDVPAQPWETGPIQVRQSSGVLGIFDADSVDSAPALLSAVADAVDAVSSRVPYEWSRSVVVYALSDSRFPDGLAGLPGDDPDAVDAVAFPVGGSTRIVLNPRMLTDGGADRDRLLRHEVTHVAIGRHDDGAPIWLSEGIAEWVAAAPIAPEDRRIPDAAVRAAEDGLTDLPDDQTFNDADSGAHYGVAWQAVERLAHTDGQDAPWRLLDGVTAPGADVDAVLADQFHTTTHDLAVQASRSILARYQPAHR